MGARVDCRLVECGVGDDVLPAAQGGAQEGRDGPGVLFDEAAGGDQGGAVGAGRARRTGRPGGPGRPGRPVGTGRAGRTGRTSSDGRPGGGGIGSVRLVGYFQQLSLESEAVFDVLVDGRTIWSRKLDTADRVLVSVYGASFQNVAHAAAGVVIVRCGWRRLRRFVHQSWWAAGDRPDAVERVRRRIDWSEFDLDANTAKEAPDAIPALASGKTDDRP